MQHKAHQVDIYRYDNRWHATALFNQQGNIVDRVLFPFTDFTVSREDIITVTLNVPIESRCVFNLTCDDEVPVVFTKFR